MTRDPASCKERHLHTGTWTTSLMALVRRTIRLVTYSPSCSQPVSKWNLPGPTGSSPLKIPVQVQFGVMRFPSSSNLPFPQLPRNSKPHGRQPQWFRQAHSIQQAGDTVLSRSQMYVNRKGIGIGQLFSPESALDIHERDLKCEKP